MFAARIARATLAAAVLVCIGLAPITHAADTAYDKIPSSHAALMKMKAMDALHLMRTDKNSVRKDEFMKFHEALFEKMDKDKDGGLSRAEWQDRH